MADKRDSSQQRRAKENRAAREALAARREAATRKANEPASTTSTSTSKSTSTSNDVEPAAASSTSSTRAARRTRAQAAPVRGRRAPAASSGGSGDDAPPPFQVPTEGSWLRRMSIIPGGRAVLMSILLAFGVAAIVFFVPRPIPIERGDHRLAGHVIQGCSTAKGKTVDTYHGRTIKATVKPNDTKSIAASAVCGPTRTTSKSAGRLLAVVRENVVSFLGPLGLIYGLIGPIVTILAAVFALRPQRRRAWTFCLITLALWTVMMLGLAGIVAFFPLAALGWAAYKAAKADPRPRRPMPPPRQRSGGGRRGVRPEPEPAVGKATSAGTVDELGDHVDATSTRSSRRRSDKGQAAADATMGDEGIDPAQP